MMKKLLIAICLFCVASAYPADPHDLRVEILNVLHMDTAGTNQVDANAVDTIIDMGYDVISKTFWSYVSDTTIVLVDAQSEYSIPSTLLEVPYGQSVLWALYTRVDATSSDPMSPIGVRAVPGDSIFSVVQEHQATPDKDKFSYVFVNNGKFWLYPAPTVTGSAESLKVCYRAKGGSTVPAAYREHLFTWCCWQVQAKRYGLESPASLAWQVRWEKLKAEPQ